MPCEAAPPALPLPRSRFKGSGEEKPFFPFDCFRCGYLKRKCCTAKPDVKQGKDMEELRFIFMSLSDQKIQTEMKCLFLPLVALMVHPVQAQQTAPSAPAQPFIKSVSLSAGFSTMVNKRYSGGTKGFWASLPNTITELAIEGPKGIGITAGYRRGTYLSSALPDDYKTGSFSLSNKASNKEYDAYHAAYLSLHYKRFFPVGRQQDLQKGILVQPTLGGAYNRTGEA